MRRDQWAVWALSLGQTLGYACFFYLFAALVLVWQRDLPFGHGLIAAGPFLAILVTAALSPMVGRWVDRGYALRLMGGGTLLGAASLGLLASSVSAVAFLVAFAGLGAAAAMTLYEVCFALLIRRFGAEARGAITRVTLVAGLASTLAFPAGAWLAASYGWRGAVWAACAVVVCAMLPAQIWGAHVLGGGRPPRSATRPPVAARWRDILARPGAWRLMLLFGVINLQHWTLVNLLRPLFADMGVAEGQAILAASLIGPAQVIGRIALMGAGARVSTNRATLGTMAGLVIAALCLLAFYLALPDIGAGEEGAPSAGPLAGLLLAFALVQGASMGVVTILRPLLIADVNGPNDYAAAAAALSLPAMAATAVSAVLGTWLLALGGALALLGVVLGLALFALALSFQQKA